MSDKMNVMEISNAVIASAVILIEDHGFLTAWIQLDYGGTGQALGGYALHMPKSFTHHDPRAGYAGQWILRTLEIAGVIKWDDLKGKTIRVKHNWSSVESIGHIVKDDWFTPSVEFKVDQTIKETV